MWSIAFSIHIHTYMHSHTHILTHVYTHTHGQVGDRSAWERDSGRELSLSLYDKFSTKLLDG
jgi:hypothetical protein